MTLGVLLLVTMQGCQPQANKNLLGLWESTTTSRGGIGNNFIFKKDGSYSTSIAVIIDTKYDIQNGKLYVAKKKDRPISYNNGKEIEIGRNGFKFINHSGQKEVRTKSAPGKEKTIVGYYKYKHYTGGTAHEQYTKDGQFKFRLPLETMAGCYFLKKNSISLGRSGKKPSKLTYRVLHGELQFTDSKKTLSYKRSPEGAWY